jgi:phosphatidylglycerophosphate synthase
VSADYHVEDRGILVAPLKRFLWGPLMQWLPIGVSANAMTLIGTVLNVAATVIAIAVPRSRPVMAIIALFLFAYFCLDNMDGAQARRTGTQSPLGEFLDHWLDGINAPAIGLCAATCWELRSDFVVVVTAMNSVAYTLTHWEHRVTGRLYLGRVGNVEGIVSVTLAFVVQAILGPQHVARFPVLLGYSATDIMAVLALVACVVIAAGAAVRARRRLAELPLLLAGAAALTAWHFLGNVPVLVVCGLLVLLTPLTGGRMIVARLTERPELRADHTVQLPILVISALCIALHPGALVQAALCGLLLAWALGRVVVEFGQTVLALSAHIRSGEFLSHFVVPRRTPR